eukprot:7362120-Prymnesium_polylepis.1
MPASLATLICAAKARAWATLRQHTRSLRHAPVLRVRCDGRVGIHTVGAAARTSPSWALPSMTKSSGPGPVPLTMTKQEPP